MHLHHHTICLAFPQECSVIVESSWELFASSMKVQQLLHTVDHMPTCYLCPLWPVWYCPSKIETALVYDDVQALEEHYQCGLQCHALVHMVVPHSPRDSGMTQDCNIVGQVLSFTLADQM